MSGPQEVIISAVDDNIRIGDGAGNFLAVNPDGSINVTVTPLGGVATAANQVIANASLASIDAKLTSPIAVTGPLTDAQLRATPVPVSATQSGTWVLGANSGVDIGDVTVNNAAGAAAVNIQDGGNSITVDGTVAATQSGAWVLSANSGVDVGDVTVNNGAGAAAVNIQDGGNSITVDGTVAATQSGVWSTRLQDGAGNAITSTVDNSLQSLNVHVTNIITVASNTRPAVTSTASTILAANLNRKYVNIFNQSGSVIFLKLGATAVINEGIRVVSNSMYEITSDNLWTGTISAIKSGAASVNIEVFEGT